MELENMPIHKNIHLENLRIDHAIDKILLIAYGEFSMSRFEPNWDL